MLKKLIGNGRKKAIQPDYTLTAASAKEPDNTVVVIECKQYEKPSIKKSDDYTGAFWATCPDFESQSNVLILDCNDIQ